MPLDHDQIVAISQDVIQRYPQPLEFVGVMASEGGSNRVEIMVTVRGCHQEPCRLLLNLSRQNQSSLQTELRRKLQAALRAHVPPPTTRKFRHAVATLVARLVTSLHSSCGQTMLTRA